MQRTATHKSTKELIEFLSNPATYQGRPHVELIETHISLVFLVGGDVFKLKKPVKFDFLDFSTKEKRKTACDAEVRLNRRMASSVYLGVEPICRTKDGKLTVGASESCEVVDWLVHMRRLDDDRQLSSRLEERDEKGKSADIRKVAEFLASFYSAQAPATVKTADFRMKLRRHIEENQSQLLELAKSHAERDQVLRVHSAQLRFLVTHDHLFESRVLDGRIVDGHGDLRPDHVYVSKNPLVIDCIEFNSDYRKNDVIDELAFLAACCDRMGEPSVGGALFDAYEKQSGDMCDPQLIAFYKAYRACVRAKIAGLRSEQLMSRESGDSLQKEHDYLDLADRYVKSLDLPFVLIVGGLMGSGKSTLARHLQQTLAAELVSSDAVRATSASSNIKLSTNGNEKAFGVGKYSLAARMANYKSMVEIAEPLLARNAGIVFDATFTTRAARQLIVDFAATHGCCVLQVECECPRDETLRRLADRLRAGKSLSEARPEYYDQQLASAEPPLDHVPLARVDTTLALAEEQAAVIGPLTELLKNRHSN